MKNPLSFTAAVMLTLAGAAFLPPRAAQAASDWPSYNRTLTSERYSPLTSINVSNVGKLKVHCEFDTGEVTGFQSGLVQVDGALFATTEHGTYSINPDTCALNWKAWEEFPSSYLGAQRGVAVEGGRVFRGGRNGHVYAYDQKTGARLWDTEIADVGAGEAVPASPIAWNGLVFIGNSGGDNRGVKGRMYGLDAATGKIVWEFYLVPKSPGDRERGPQAPGAAPADTWQNVPGIDISGGAVWTSFTLDPERGELYVPGGNPAPDFDKGVRKGSNLFAGAIVVLDARTGAYKRHFSVVPADYHDWDVASAPLLANVQGRRLMTVTPKDGLLYTYDLADNRELYRRAVTTRTNADKPLSAKKAVRFCPGITGGSEWNGPAFDQLHSAFITGQVDWCVTMKLDPDTSAVHAVKAGQAWTGLAEQGFGIPDEKWGGWVTSVDALTGKRRWRVRNVEPILAGVTPTAGNVVFFGDRGGTLHALNANNGYALGQWKFDGAIGGGVITYDTGAGQKVAVATGMNVPIWKTSEARSKIVVLALE